MTDLPYRCENTLDLEEKIKMLKQPTHSRATVHWKSGRVEEFFAELNKGGRSQKNIRRKGIKAGGIPHRHSRCRGAHMTPANQNEKHCNIDDFFWHVDQLGYARRGWDSIARGICSETYLKFYWYLQQEVIAREIMAQIRRESVRVIDGQAQ